jgi:hypothetical protein
MSAFDDMEMPVFCTRCGKCIELNDSNFRVPGNCECRNGCTHGICNECKEECEERMGARA